MHDSQPRVAPRSVICAVLGAASMAAVICVLSLNNDSSRPGKGTQSAYASQLFWEGRNDFKGEVAPPNVALPWGPAECFVNPVWKPDDVSIEGDIAYGSAYNPVSGKNETLLLDIYQPPSSDKRLRRPVAVLVHGGAFVYLSKTADPTIPTWGKELAQRGYVVIAPNYRLATLLTLQTLDPPAPVMAAEDVRAAVRYAYKMAEEYRLDTDRIMIGGDSAGAITSLTYAYMKNQPAGASGNPGYGSNVHAVVSLSGALGGTFDLVFMKLFYPDLSEEIKRGDIPAVLVHGTDDTLVSYAGGLKVHERLDHEDVRNDFLKVPGAGHVPQEFFEEPYLNKWLHFISGALNLADAECPRLG